MGFEIYINICGLVHVSSTTIVVWMLLSWNLTYKLSLYPSFYHLVTSQFNIKLIMDYTIMETKLLYNVIFIRDHHMKLMIKSVYHYPFLCELVHHKLFFNHHCGSPNLKFSPHSLPQILEVSSIHFHLVHIHDEN